MSDNERPKVIVIGLDGATWDLIKPWADEEKLPNFKKLIDHGGSATLKSTIPPISPSAWTSIYTGCTPAKHGIFGFMKRKKNSYFYRPITSKDRKKPAIWELISRSGKRPVVINGLFTYPLPADINGVIVSGLGAPSKKSDFVHPPELKEYILDNFPDYDVDFNEDQLLVSDKLEGFLERVMKVTRAQADLTLEYIKKDDADFIFSIFRALDVVQHYYWRDKEVLFDYYLYFDRLVGKILEEVEEDRYLFIVSDHGFSEVKKYFCVNNWLEKNGFISLHKRRSIKLIPAESIKKVLLSLGLRDLVWRIKHSRILEKALRLIPSEEMNYINNVDFDKSKAYFYEGSDGIINVNLMGREPNGTVKKDDYEAVIKKIMDGLRTVVDPENGESIIKAVYSKNLLYGTSKLEVPDIFVLMKDGYRAVGNNKKNDGLFTSPVHGRLHRIGDHNINGIFICYGKDIANISGVSVNVWDIAPTILHILNLPIYDYMDGRVLKEFFTGSLLYRKKVHLRDFTNEKVKRLKELGRI